MLLTNQLLAILPGYLSLIELCLIAGFVFVDIILVFVIIFYKKSIHKKQILLAAEKLNKEKDTEESVMQSLLPSAEQTVSSAQPQVIIVNNGVPQATVAEKTYEITEAGIDDSAAASEEDTTDDNKVILDDNSKIVDKDAVTFSSKKRLTLDEAYNALSKEQKSFFDKLYKYAMDKGGTKEKRNDNYIQIKVGTKPLTKMSIQRGVTVLSLIMEDKLLKDYRKSLEEGNKISVKATQLKVINVDTFEMAKGLIDVAFERAQQDIAADTEARKAKRRERRQAKNKVSEK